MKSFVSSLAALFLAVGVIGCGDAGSAPEPTPAAEDQAAADMHAAMSEGETAPSGHEAAAPAEGEGDTAAPAEGDAAAPAEGDAATPAETEAAAPAEGESKSE